MVVVSSVIEHREYTMHSLHLTSEIEIQLLFHFNSVLVACFWLARKNFKTQKRFEQNKKNLSNLFFSSLPTYSYYQLATIAT